MLYPRGSPYSNFTDGKVACSVFPTSSHPEVMYSTEAGSLTDVLPKEMNKDWEWLRFSSLIKPHFIPDGHGAYELVVEVRYSTHCYAVIPGWTFDVCAFSPHQLIGPPSTTLK